MATESNSNPIAAKPTYGNYKGYYQSKRPTTSLDSRLALLPNPSTFFKKRRVLDVGCNEGWVTCEIAQRFAPQHIIGVDIDPGLIRSAWKRRRMVWSLQQPWLPTKPGGKETSQSDAENQLIREGKTKTKSRKRARYAEDIENAGPETLNSIPVEFASPTQPVYDYFPLAMEHMFGPIHIPNLLSNNDTLESTIAFPHNVTFRTADWIDQIIPEDKEVYDIVIAFSISKWIHLNKGDDGLKRFFRKVYDVLSPGGSFILESQPWDSYIKAKRMDERLKETYQTLQLRPDVFPAVLTNEVGFASRQELGRTGEGGFDRPVDIYVKPFIPVHVSLM